MIDLERRLRRTFSNMAASESLAEVLDDIAAGQMVKWGEGLARQFVLRTSEMDDNTAAEYLAPYFSALRRMMRAIGGVTISTDESLRLEWWNLIEQNGKTLYGDSFILPDMKNVQTQISASAGSTQLIAFIQNLVENQKAKGF
jgi:hypothetical protein